MSIFNLRNYLTILGNQPDYEPIINQAKQLIEIQNRFLQIIPSSIGSRCAVGKYSNGVILIYTDNGVIASRLRQLAPAILRHFSNNNLTINEIKIAVQPNPSQGHPPDSRKRTQRLNSSATRHLNDLIATLPDESPLRQALVKLLFNNKQQV